MCVYIHTHMYEHIYLKPIILAKCNLSTFSFMASVFMFWGLFACLSHAAIVLCSLWGADCTAFQIAGCFFVSAIKRTAWSMQHDSAPNPHIWISDQGWNSFGPMEDFRFLVKPSASYNTLYRERSPFPRELLGCAFRSQVAVSRVRLSLSS